MRASVQVLRLSAAPPCTQSTGRQGLRFLNQAETRHAYGITHVSKDVPFEELIVAAQPFHAALDFYQAAWGVSHFSGVRRDHP